MIDKIGTGPSGQPLILAELNDTERQALTDILWFAEQAPVLASVRGLRPDAPRGLALRIMLRELRSIHELDDDNPPPQEA